MIITTIIVSVLFFVSGFGFGWCLRGDRFRDSFNRWVVQKRDGNRLMMRAPPDIEQEILRGLARERALIEQKKKESRRWN